LSHPFSSIKFRPTLSFIRRFIHKPWDFEVLTTYLIRNSHSDSQTSTGMGAMSGGNASSGAASGGGGGGSGSGGGAAVHFGAMAATPIGRIGGSMFPFSEVIQLITDFPDKPWNWNYITINSPARFIDEHIELPWNFHLLSQTSSVFTKSLELLHLVQKHIDFNWDFHRLSSIRDPIIYDLVRSYPDKPWNWSAIMDIPSYDFSTRSTPYHFMESRMKKTHELLAV